MADYLNDEYIFNLMKEIRYLRRILNSLKPIPFNQDCEWPKVVQEQEKILNTLRGDFAIKMTDLEQRLKQNTIRLFGIPEQKNEDTKFVILDFFQKTLNVDVTPHDIDFCYRALVPKNWRPRAVVVKFVCDDVRKKVWRRRHFIESNTSGMTQELCTERSVIWKEAVHAFGRNCVTVVEGSVQVKMPGGRVERFSTTTQFWNFMARHNLKVYPFG